jgi:alpha-L-rhamnosidase
MTEINRRQLLFAAGAIAVNPQFAQGDQIAPAAAGSVVIRPVEMRPVRMCTECIDRPMGLEVQRPRFSWALEGSGRNLRQRAYRLTVASSAGLLSAGQGDLWDSGRVESDQCFDIAYAGSELHSGQRAFWRVQLWDHRDHAAVGEATWFEMGLLGADAWRAQWLAVANADEKADRAAGLHWIWGDQALDPRVQMFRYRCQLAAAPAQAELLLAAKDTLRGVWVNGAVVPLPENVFWGSMIRLSVKLIAGANVICVAAAAATSGFFPPDGGAVAALLKVTDAAGRAFALEDTERALAASACNAAAP